MAENAHPTRLSELDALRGIAAVVVMLFHYTFRGGALLPELQMIPWQFQHAHYGVEMFFAISGFVILMTLERTSSASDFIVSRMARLYPTFWFSIIFTSVGLLVLNIPKLTLPIEVVLANFTMLHEYFYVPSVDGVYWSLTVELGFYFCMLVLWRIRWLSQIERVLLVWILLKLVCSEVPKLPSMAEAVLVVRYIPWFAIGIVAYRVHTGARTWQQQLPVLLLGAAVCTYIDGWADVFVFAGLCVVFAVMNSGRLSFINCRLLLWLGAISYPFYLIHQYLGYAVMVHLQRYGVPVWVTFAIAIATVLTAAQMIHVLVERPSLTAIRNWWKNRKATATA